MKFKVATAQPKSDSNILKTVGWSSQAIAHGGRNVRDVAIIQAR
jgi:hypothetical protein